MILRGLHVVQSACSDTLEISRRFWNDEARDNRSETAFRNATIPSWFCYDVRSLELEAIKGIRGTKDIAQTRKAPGLAAQLIRALAAMQTDLLAARSSRSARAIEMERVPELGVDLPRVVVWFPPKVLLVSNR
jgi:hypothetical protein